MTQKDLIALARGLATVLKDFSARLDAKAKGLDGPMGPIGPEGKPGRDGRDGIMGLTGEKGIDGKHGEAGRDGFSPDDLDFDWIPETRSLKIKLLRDGVLVKEVEKPLNGIPIWKGTYAAGKSYVYGDITTWNGGWWIAKASTTDKPGDGKTAWQLTVMRGEKGERGEEGRAGRAGKDLTQLLPDGTKFR